MADQANPFSDPEFGKDATTTDNPFSNPDFGKPSGMIRRVADQGIKLAQGVIGVPETAVGIADLVTNGQAGKLAESAGVRFKDAKSVLGDFLSPEQQAADKAVNDAHGFLPTVGAMVQNPSTIVGQAMESAPTMLSGGLASRGLLKIAPKIGAIAAGAAGEGLVTAGQNAEQVRQEDPNGTLTPEQSAIMAASGALTGAIGFGSGKVANKLGIGDVQTMLAQGKLGTVGAEAGKTAAGKGMIRKVSEGVANEGILQELPQSYQEQVAQNLAQGKPWDEGAAAAGAQGMMAGALMGGGANAVSHFTESPASPPPAPQPEQAPPGQTAPGGLALAPYGQTGPNKPDELTPYPGGMSSVQKTFNPRDPNSKPPLALMPMDSPDGIDYTPDQTFIDPVTGLKTTFFDGGMERTYQTAPPKPSEAMGLAPTAAPSLTNAAIVAVDTGVYQGIALEDAAVADQAAYEQAITTQQEQSAQQDTADKPITTGKLADARLSEDDKRAMLYSNQPVIDGGMKFTGTQDGDILNGMGAPFSTKFGAQRRARMEGKDWTIATVFDGFVARRKDALNDTSTTHSGVDQPAATAPSDQPNGSGMPAVGPVPAASGNAGDPGTTGAPTVASDPVLDAGSGTDSVAPTVTSDTAPSKENTENNPAAQAEQAQVATDNIAKNDSGEPVNSSVNSTNESKGAVKEVVQSTAPESPQAPYQGDEPLIGEYATKREAMQALEGYYVGTVQRSGDKFALYAKSKKPAAPAPAKSEQAKADVEHLFGLPEKRAKAIDRIAKGTAYFSKPLKAQEFITKNGLKETHQSVKTARGWDIVAKPGKVTDSKLPPTDIQMGDQIKSKGNEYTVTGPIDGGISAERTVKQSNGVTETETIFLKGDEAIQAKLDSQPTEKTSAQTTKAIEVQAKQPEAPAASVDEPNFQGAKNLLAQQKAATGNAIAEASIRKKVRDLAAKTPINHEKTVTALDIAATRLGMGEGKLKGLEFAASDAPAVEQVPVNTPVVNEGIWIATGRADFSEGKPRVLPSYFTKPGDKNSKDWYRGWDAANAAAPVRNMQTANAKPEIVTDKAEMRPYRKPDGSVGYEAVPIQAETPAVESEKGTLGEIDVERIKKNINDPEKIKQVMDGIQSMVDAQTKPAAKPDTLSDKEKAAKAKMFNALGKLATLAGKNTRMNWTPEEEQQLLPIVIELFDGAMELGSVTFQKAVRYVREFIAGNLDQATADAIPFETLQGAYIHTARKYKDQGATTGKEVMSFDSLEELDKSAEKADIETKDITNDSPATTPTPTLDSPVAEGQRPAGSETPTRGDKQSRDRKGRSDDGGVRRDGQLRVDESNDEGRIQNGDGRTDSVGQHEADGGMAGGLQRVHADFIPGIGGLTREGSWFESAKRNIDLIELAIKIESENRAATPDEQAQLAKYVGFGASAIRNDLFPVPPAYAKAQQPNKLIWPEFARNERFKPLAERIEALPREWQQSILQSSQYAHYTSEGIIRSVWSALQRMGFTGGNVFEPGMGIGSFAMLMPNTIRNTSRYTGVEFDAPTALIARLLSPDQNMIHGDFIKKRFPENFFDVNVGNPPFSQTKILGDSKYAKNGFMLHDFFFAKGIDLVRPGGIQVFVTSKGTMDKQNDKARKYLSDRADLLGAIRLPSTAFEDNAGTSVVTDVIFLRKRLPGEQPAGEAWGSTASVDTKDGPVLVNEYFAKHPEMVLGQQRISGNTDDMGRRINSNGMGGEKYTVVSYDTTAAELDAKFAQAIEKLPENAYSVMGQSSQSIKDETAKIDFDPSVKREGVVYMAKDGTIMRVEQGVGKPLDGMVKLSDKDKAWFKGYVGLRDLVQESRFSQLNDGEWEKSLAKLNKAHDKFVKDHGNIRDFRVLSRNSTDEDGNVVTTEIRIPKNKRLFREDYDQALVTALEDVIEDGTIVKAPFLKGRTIGKPVSRDVRTIGDALAVSLDEHGTLDLDDVAQRMKLSRDEVIDSLGNQIYQTPTGQWQLADEYLAGDVVSKLEEAEQAARLNPALQRNVEALKAAQPEKLGPSQISAKLGASWIPESHVNEFSQEIGAGEVAFDPKTESWTVQGGNERSARKAGAEYGTAKRSPSELLEAILNSRSIKITQVVDKKTVNDEAATTAANETAKKIKDKFKGWVWTDTNRASELVESYNHNFNNIAPRRFDGSHLTLPGVSLRYKLHPHQLRAIWRMIQTGNTYLAHAVGAGKTIEMIAGGMEQKRLGLIKKPMYVVPNHMLEQFSNEFMELYPLANIMVADDENFSADRRKAFIASATLNNPDAIIITHDAFQRIGVKEESVAPIRDEILADLEIELSETAKDNDGRVRRGQLQQQIEAVTQRFDKIIGAGQKDSTIKFEDMGVDFVFADEAHTFRKLDFHTAQSIKGIDPNGSKRALDMYVKTRILEKNKPGRSFSFASGTPVTNTMGELYTIMRFFAGAELDKSGISTFDAWARQFGEVVAALEPNAAGAYQIVERFAKFDNVPELMSRVRQFMDVLTSDNLGALVKRPDLAGGKPNLNIIPTNAALTDYMKGELARRIEISKAWKPSPGEKGNPDPIVSIITDGRFAAIDPRFFGGEMQPGETSIITEMGDSVAKNYHATKNNVYTDKDGKPEAIKGSTQIVFYNLGFGEGAQRSRGFNSRDAFTKRLTDGGIPRHEIAWFDDANTDAKKEAVFKDMRSGKLKVLIGSAKKMGTGVNVQKRLGVLHYQDPPWFPADVEQPHGRIIRQGNQNGTVAIEWYTTKGTYQSTMWQMVGRKQRFIDQAFTGDKTMRSMDDLGEASLFEQAAAVASGDPRAIQLAGLKQDVERFERLQAAHASEQISVRTNLRSAQWSIEMLQKRITQFTKAFKAIGEKYFAFASGKVGSTEFSKVGEFGQAVKEEFNKVAAESMMTKRIIGKQIASMGDVLVKIDSSLDKNNQLDGKFDLYVEFGGMTFQLANASAMGVDVDAVGLARRIFNQINSVSSDLSTDRRRLVDEETDSIKLSKKLGAPFEYQQEMAEKYGELKRLEAELKAEGETNPDVPLAITPDGEIGAGAVFSTSDSAPEKQLPLNQIERLVQSALRGMKNAPNVRVVANPEAIGLRSPVDTVPSGVTLANGDVYVFQSGVGSALDVDMVVFHELFHKGLQNVMPKADYVAAMQEISKADSKVRQYASEWSDSKAAKSQMEELAKKYNGKELADQYEALAIEEALARIAEDLKAKREMGTKAIRVRRLVAWLAKVADKLGMTRFADKLRALSYNEAERFVIATIGKAGGNGPNGGVRYSAPNGTSATDKTQTAAFKSWFGDSKVVDAQGKPIVMYHETSNQFTKMPDGGIEVFKTPSFFSPTSKDYFSAQGTGMHKYPVYLSLQNPKITTDFDLASEGVYDKWPELDGYDGVMLMGTDGKLVHAVAFNPTQIKSATGNNGNFDPTNADIRFKARDIGDTLTSAANNVRVNKVVDKLNEHFNHEGTLSWWHKTVGSPFDLAQRSAPFKRVFTEVQDFINGVSFYSNEAADLAPKLLPKLENWRDINKSPISSEDNKAIQAPIFQGTLSWARDETGKLVKIEALEAAAAQLTPEQKAQRLLRGDHISEGVLKMWHGLPVDRFEAIINGKYESDMLKAGVVFTDQELKSVFKLTPEQIKLYREFRSATDKSLDNLAKAEMLRFGGKDAIDMRDMVMDAKDADDASVLLRDHFLQAAIDEPGRSDELTATANSMIERGDKVKKLKEQGYAPLSRFGQYSVDVVVDGERQYFSLFETKREANQMAAKMKMMFGANNVKSGTVSQLEFQLLQGITPESLELFGNMLGLDSTGDEASDKAFQTYLKLTKNNRSAMKRMIHRKGIAGFNEDAGRVLAAFVYSNGRQTAGALHMGEITQSVNDIPQGQGQLKDAAVRLRDYVQNPKEEAQAMRGLLFAQYLGGSVASAFINFTQPFTVSFPYLSQFGGAKRAGAALLQAMKDQKSGNYEPALANALKKADEEGTTQPQAVHELMAQSRGAATLKSGDGTRSGEAMAQAGNALSKLSMGWGKLFGLAEQINRRSTYIAAFRLAVENKVADPAGFAKQAVDETQFINNKGNKARWGRGAVGATLMTFKSYSINYLELLHRMATKNGPEGKKAAALALGMLFLMAGAGGMPGADDLDDVIDFFAQRLGYNVSSSKARQEFLEELFGPAGALFVERGLTGLPGSPIDVSGRMSMGNLIPGTGLLLKKRDHTRDATEILGAMGDMVQRGFKAGDLALDGNIFQAVMMAAPKAVGNAYKGAQMADSGAYKDDKGYKVQDTTPGEAAFKAIGFQPASVSKVQESNYLTQRAKDFYSLQAADIRARWARGIYEKDQSQVQQARDMMADWNEKNPDQRIQANIPAILKRVNEMRKTKEQRIADTAPKAMKAQLRREIAERAAQ